MDKWKDFITGICGMLFSAVLYILSVQIGLKENQAIGADFLPKIAAVILFVMFLILAIRGYGQVRSEQKKQAREFAPNYKGVAIVFLVMLLYAFLLKEIGFIITSMAFLYFAIFMMTKKEEFKPVKSIFITVIVVLAIYYIFTAIFGIRLPKGIL